MYTQYLLNNIATASDLDRRGVRSSTIDLGVYTHMTYAILERGAQHCDIYQQVPLSLFSFLPLFLTGPPEETIAH